MLRTALGPAIAEFLDDPSIVEVMLNRHGRLWIDRLADGLADTGERLSPPEGERIIRLFARHVGAEVHPGAPRVSAGHRRALRRTAAAGRRVARFRQRHGLRAMERDQARKRRIPGACQRLNRENEMKSTGNFCEHTLHTNHHKPLILSVCQHSITRCLFRLSIRPSPHDGVRLREPAETASCRSAHKRGSRPACFLAHARR
ncbi:Type II/IV secretion system protein [Bosea sp. CRIB-10]|nr:Type II/IV secretion system protein [Bosea sp. CRIB-10]